MTRKYEVEVYAKGISEDELGKLMTQRFGWEETALSEYRGILCFTGEGWLSGSQTEKQAHEQIYKALKAINPKALISTHWTYLEELPYSRYGDDLNGGTPDS